MEKDPLQQCGDRFGERVDSKPLDQISVDDYSYAMEGIEVEVKEIPVDVVFEVPCRVYPCSLRERFVRKGKILIRLVPIMKVGTTTPCGIKAMREEQPRT